MYRCVKTGNRTELIIIVKCPANTEAPLMTIGPPILSNMGMSLEFKDTGGALISMVDGSNAVRLRGRRLKSAALSCGWLGIFGKPIKSVEETRFNFSDLTTRMRFSSTFTEMKSMPMIILAHIMSTVSPTFNGDSIIPRSFFLLMRSPFTKTPLTLPSSRFPRSCTVQAPFTSKRIVA